MSEYLVLQCVDFLFGEAKMSEEYNHYCPTCQRYWTHFGCTRDVTDPAFASTAECTECKKISSVIVSIHMDEFESYVRKTREESGT